MLNHDMDYIVEEIDLSRMENNLDLQKFYPDEMDVSQIIQKDKEIHLKIFVRSKIALAQSAEWFQDTDTVL